MSEDKEQAVTEETDVQPAAVTEESGAQEQKKEDDLDTLLAEFEQETGKSTEQTDTKTDDDTAERIKRLERQLSERDYRTDIEKTITAIRGDLNEEQFDSAFMDAWLNAKAKEDDRVAKAWMRRHDEPKKFARVVEGLGREFSKKYGKLSGRDEDATSDREAVAQAVRSHGNKAPEGTAPDYSRVSDQEFSKSVREKYGFTPPV